MRIKIAMTVLNKRTLKDYGMTFEELIKWLDNRYSYKVNQTC